jgi:hypothetical protein
MKRIVIVLGVICIVTGIILASKSRKPPTPSKTRDELIKEQIAVIDAELQAHGGTWEAWWKSLEPFRADIDNTLKNGWPSEVKVVGSGHIIGDGSIIMPTIDWDARSVDPVTPIKAFSDHMKAAGIDLIVIPVPSQAEVNPDLLSKDHAPADFLCAPSARKMCRRMLSAGIEIVDILPNLLKARREAGAASAEMLFTPQDDHWTDAAIQIAVKATVRHLLRFDFVQQAMASEASFTTKEVEKSFPGQNAQYIPLSRFKEFPPMKICATQILNTRGEPFKEVEDSLIMVVGDSFTSPDLFGVPETGFSHRLYQQINIMPTRITVSGSGMKLPQDLARMGPEILKNRKVMIWIFNSCYLQSAK